MGWFIASRPGGRDARDHFPDVTVSLDQLGEIFRWQIKSGLTREEYDFVLGQGGGHVKAPGCGVGQKQFTPSRAKMLWPMFKNVTRAP